MAPLKFEENIKEKLEERTIQPSKKSWSKLADQLDGEKEEDSSLKNKWLFIAASVIGFLVLTSVFMTSNDENKFEQHQIVDNGKEKIEIQEKNELVHVRKEKVIPVNIITTEILDESKTIENINKSNDIVIQNTKDEVVIAEINTENKSIPINEKDSKVQVNNAVASKHENKKTVENKNEFLVDTGDLENKFDNILAQVQAVEEGNQNQNVTDEEVNTLVYNAQEEIVIQQVNAATVNASTLLLDVELELDESFKKRVFEALKTGFQKLKTSVAEREN